MDAPSRDRQPGDPPRLGRGAVVAGAVLAVALAGVLARVDADTSGALTVERQTPDPAPTTPAAAESRWGVFGAWRRMAVSPVPSRSGHVAQWSGSCRRAAAPRSCGELLIWGGHEGGRPKADGAAYDPATDSWRTLPEAPRSSLADASLPGAWTGAVRETRHGGAHRPAGELIVWGATGADLGMAGAAPDEPRGVALDPVTGSWRILADAPIAPRVGHSMTWTGDEVVVWGGHGPSDRDASEPFADGAAYDPERDAWRLLPPAPLRARSHHVAAYLPGARAVLVWGGQARRADQAGTAALTDGAVYHLAEGRWRPLPPMPLSPVGPQSAWGSAAAPDPRAPDAVVLVAALVDARRRPALASYEPGAEEWEILPSGPVGLRSGAQAAGDGRAVVIWGGSHPLADEVPPGAVFHADTGEWRRMAGRYRPRPGDRAVWTGSELLVWGGGGEGGVFDPSARSRPGLRSHAAGERRTADLPGGSTTNWPMAPSGEPMSVDVRGVGAAEVEAWLTWGRGRFTTRREPAEVHCPWPDRCEHRFEPVPSLVPGVLRLHLANRDVAAAAVGVTVEPLPCPNPPRPAAGRARLARC